MEHGRVLIGFDIDSAGTPVKLAVLESCPIFDEAALSAVAKWKYAHGPKPDKDESAEAPQAPGEPHSGDPAEP